MIKTNKTNNPDKRMQAATIVKELVFEVILVQPFLQEKGTKEASVEIASAITSAVDELEDLYNS